MSTSSPRVRSSRALGAGGVRCGRSVASAISTSRVRWARIGSLSWSRRSAASRTASCNAAPTPPARLLRGVSGVGVCGALATASRAAVRPGRPPLDAPGVVTPAAAPAAAPAPAAAALSGCAINAWGT